MAPVSLMAVVALMALMALVVRLGVLNGRKARAILRLQTRKPAAQPSG